MSFRSSQLLLLLTALTLIQCTPAGNEKLFTISGQTMGTTYSVKFVAPDGYGTAVLKKKIEDTLDEVNRQMSTYIPDSEISQLNKAPAQSPVKISSWFAQTLRDSLQLAQKTNGRFDPTIGPLVNLWGFGPKKSKTVPKDQRIAEVKEYVGFDKLSLSAKNGTWFAIKKHDKVYVDLSASAKGFGVDILSRLLSQEKIKNHLVEIGGELRGQGKKFKQNWQVAIEKPDSTQRSIHQVLKLDNRALATSGNYRNFFESGGKTFSHSIDQRTGKPVEHNLLSVSVLAESCMEADGLATALMVMGPQEALKYAEKNK
jgi:thiamine biosynthesis lipoprotein